MTAKDKRERIVLHGEDLDAAVRDLNEFIKRQAEALRRDSPDRSFSVSKRKPNIDALFEEHLRAALEDEIVPAVQTDEQNVIQPPDLDRELIKKALAGLRLDTLRKIATRAGIKPSGALEDLTTQIGRSFRWDAEEIARLVLENEPEPREERAYTERLFPLADSPDLDYVADRLKYVLGRYIRTGIARWFVFERLTVEETRMSLTGTLRAYRADVADVDDTPSVIPVPRAENPIDIIIDTSGVLKVLRGNAMESSAAVRALATATHLRPLDFVPFRMRSSGVATPIDFAAASLFMLDLVTSRLRRAGLRDLNLTVARFRVDDKTESATGAMEDTRPRLRAVRFEGAHLLDSPPACKLLDEGRALVDIAMTVEPQRHPEAESGRFPVRIAIERDHVVAVTGFGVIPSLAVEVHRLVVESVIDEILEGIADPGGLGDLAARIKERARTTMPVERADMLQDSGDDGTEFADEHP